MRVLLVALCISIGALGFPGCSSSTIVPSVEVLSPTQSQPVEYMAKPADVLGPLIFSGMNTEQEETSIWSESRGKWVLWVGSVEAVEPKLKPSRLIFLYEYDTSGLAIYNKFGVAVDFNPSMTERLRQLTQGQRVYYRAKLGQRETAGLFTSAEYGSGISGFLVLSEGEVITSDDPAAVLADLAYSSYEQLDRLVADAERIASLDNYFQRAANLSTDVAWQLSKLALGFVNIRLTGNTQLQKVSLPAMSEKALSAKSEIEDSLGTALASLHYDAGGHGEYDRQGIERKIESSERIAGVIGDGIRDLESVWFEDKRSSELDLGDLVYEGTVALIGKALPEVELIIGITQPAGDGMAEIGRLPLYQQMIVICQTYLALTDGTIQHIRDVAIDTMSDSNGVD